MVEKEPTITVAIELLPEKPGEYAFACQMGLFRGKLIVECGTAAQWKQP